MTSTNYTIYADSTNVGGFYGTSTSYDLFSGLSESPVGFATSSSYEVRGGYQSMERGTLSMSISGTALNLGTLNIASVSSASSVVTITTDSSTGYSLSIGSVSGTGLTAVSDGAVTAGSEEYGLAVSGTDAAFANDQGIAASLALASANSAVTSRETTLTFKASISSDSTAGSRSQSITLTASANF